MMTNYLKLVAIVLDFMDSLTIDSLPFDSTQAGQISGNGSVVEPIDQEGRKWKTTRGQGPTPAASTCS